MTWTKTVLFAASLMVALGHGAAGATDLPGGCEKAQTLDDTQIREGVRLIRDAQADEFEQVFAYESLRCSARRAVREIVRRAGLTAAHNPSVQASALFDTLSARQSVTIRFSNGEALGPDEAKFVTSRNGAISYKVTRGGRAGEKAVCIETCNTNFHSTDIQGTRLTFLHSSGDRGEFNLGNDGRLVGRFYHPDLPAGIEAHVALK